MTLACRADYTEALGMQLLRKSDNSEYRYTLAFVGYGMWLPGLLCLLTSRSAANNSAMLGRERTLQDMQLMSCVLLPELSAYCAGPEQDNLVIELTYNWGDNKYTLGDGYGQVAIQTTDGALLASTQNPDRPRD